MEQSWENFPLEMEMDDDRDLFEECQTEEFLRDILNEPAFSSESESQPIGHGSSSLSLSSDEMVSVGGSKRLDLSNSSPTPRTYILSFDNSTIIPATPEPQPFSSSQPLANRSSKKRPLHQNLNSEPRPKPKPKSTPLTQTRKTARTDSQTLDHIMAERKRRQELTQRFIALSATIPGLKKTDKSSILREAINYVKQLQERVTELEQRNKRGKESTVILKKIELCGNEDTNSSDTNSEDSCRPSEMLPDVEARVMQNEVLIDIHCEKEDGIELKILNHIENFHLSVIASSVLPFGDSTLGITIVAQMGDLYKMTVNDLVKKLRQVLLNHMNFNTDPY